MAMPQQGSMLSSSPSSSPAPDPKEKPAGRLDALGGGGVLDTLANDIGMDAIGSIPQLGDADPWVEVGPFQSGTPPENPDKHQRWVRVEWRDGTVDSRNYRERYAEGYQPRRASEAEKARYPTTTMKGHSVFFMDGMLLMEIDRALYAKLEARQQARIDFQSAGVQMASETNQFDSRFVRFTGTAKERVGRGRDATALIDD